MKKRNLAGNDLQDYGYSQASGDAGDEMNIKKFMRTNMSMSKTYACKECQSEQILVDSSTQAPEGTNHSFHTYTLNMLVKSLVLQHTPLNQTCFLW